MRFNIRWLFVAVSLIALVLGILSYRALQQRITVRQLLEHKLVSVQFSNGEYCDSVSVAEQGNHFFATVNVVYLDVPGVEGTELIPLLRQLPSLSRLVLRHQGEDLAAFNRQQNEIGAAFTKQEKEIREAFPGMEVLNISSVVEVRNAK